MSVAASIYSSLGQIDANQWNQLTTDGYPFTRHEFLHALEQHHCLKEFGWTPIYFLLEDKSSGDLIAALPAYIKFNGYGELVFDQAWGQAYERQGKPYYPKLVTAIPYTPATGPRFLIHPDYFSKSTQWIHELSALAQQFCIKQELSGWHLLFLDKESRNQLPHQVFSLRYDCQYHWENQSYQQFDDFLSQLSSRKRKNIRKERKKIIQSGIEIKRCKGNELSPTEWQRVYQLYRGIFDRKYGTATLTASFFETVGQSMGDQIMVVLACQNDVIIACSLFYHSNQVLYGRLWGCEDYQDFLHFECCYYQGIDYCIEHGLEKFDPGAQGEHKISRGFLPQKTCSAHWFPDQEFHQIINHHLQQETHYIDQMCNELMHRSPYRQTVD